MSKGGCLDASGVDTPLFIVDNLLFVTIPDTLMEKGLVMIG